MNVPQQGLPAGLDLETLDRQPRRSYGFVAGLRPTHFGLQALEEFVDGMGDGARRVVSGTAAGPVSHRIFFRKIIRRRWFLVVQGCAHPF